MVLYLTLGQNYHENSRWQWHFSDLNGRQDSGNQIGELQRAPKKGKARGIMLGSGSAQAAPDWSQMSPCCLLTKVTHWNPSSEDSGFHLLDWGKWQQNLAPKAFKPLFFCLFLSYPKRAKLCSSSWKKNFSTRSKENKRKKGQKVNFTFFFSHFLQAEVNYSGTQAEANQCDRSLALRKKERKKCHQMVFSLERETGLGIPESLRHRAPACASHLKYWSDLVGFKEIRSPQSYPQFNMENSTYPSILYVLIFRKSTEKKFMTSSYNKADVSNRTKTDAVTGLKFPNENLLQGTKFS